MTVVATGTVRLLPWTSGDGRPCYLLGGGSGRVSRFADHVESAQLDGAADLLDRAADLLADEQAPASDIRFLADRLAMSLREVRRVAESRGARLPPPPYEDEETDDADEEIEDEQGDALPAG